MTIESQIAELKRRVLVMEAYKLGEEVQWRSLGEDDWRYFSMPNQLAAWEWDRFDYRVKPKKREVWLRENDSISWWGGTLHQQKALQQVEPNSPGAIRFVEAD